MVSLNPMSWLKRGKTEQDKEFTKVAAASALQRPTEKTEFDKLLGEKSWLVRDSDVQDNENVACYSYIFNFDDKGKVTGVNKYLPDYNGQAIRLLNSPYLSLGNITPKDAKLYKLMAQVRLKTILAEKNEMDFDSGIVNYLKATQLHVMYRFDDSVQGRKAQQFTERKLIQSIEAKTT